MIGHTFKTSVADGANAAKLRPSNWGRTGQDLSTNPTHEFTGGAQGGLLFRDTGASDGANWITAAAGVLACAGVGEVPAFRALTAGDIPNLSATYEPVITTLGPTRGGTGFGSYTVGDLLYASAANALGKLADVAVGSVLVSGGIGAAPAWSQTPTLNSVTVEATSSFETGTGTLTASENGGHFGVTSVVYSDTLSGNFRGRRAKGTAGSPSPVIADDFLACFTGGGWTGTQFPTSSQGALIIAAAGNYSDSSHPTQLLFYTTAAGATSKRIVGKFLPTGTFEIGFNGNDSDAILHFVETADGWTIRHKGTDGTLRFAPTLGGTDRMILTDTGQLVFNAATAPNDGGASVRQTRLLTLMADNTAVSAFTLTIPNDTNGATLRINVSGVLGDFDSTNGKMYLVALSRTAGAATKATISAAFGDVSTTGATANATTTVTVTSPSGANNATQTINVQVKVARSAGSATNHRASTSIELLNMRGSGITIAAA